MFIVVFVVMLPVYLNTKDPMQAWQAGLAWAFLIGVIVMIGAFVGPYIRKLTPRAAMLGTLAGISITFISMRPAAQMWEAAWIGLPVMAIILIGFFTNVKLPVRHPGRARRAARRHRDRLDRRLHVGTRCRAGGLRHRDRHTRPAARHAVLRVCRNLAPLLGTAIPLGVYNFTEAMSNVESAAAAGDNYNLRSVLLADGAGAVIGSAFGSPFPPAVYIGHPGWKDAGGRAGYSLASGVVIGLLCFLGLFGVLDALLPVPAIVPILLYIGLLIGAQAFQAVPRLHAIAVVAAILPNLAQWASGLIDNALNAAGTSADKVGLEALNGAGVVYEGLQTLGEGAVLVGLILGTMVTFILEKKFLYAAIASAVGAVLSFIGLIHAPEVAWAANPEVALGYLFFGIVCVAYSFLPGAKDPVEVDEADIVAGH